MIPFYHRFTCFLFVLAIALVAPSSARGLPTKLSTLIAVSPDAWQSKDAPSEENLRGQISELN
ncbi:MAG: hypothetical protein DCC75_03585 [Proteobacteria bacterium]|nr:MAG: hypothetical protein DCC75_03585 [Pseudomonadota bacterium]